MDEDRFNISLRKFLKEVGVTSQRELEKAVWGARDAGKLAGQRSVDAKMTLEVPALGLVHVVTRTIDVD